MKAAPWAGLEADLNVTVTLSPISAVRAVDALLNGAARAAGDEGGARPLQEQRPRSGGQQQLNEKAIARRTNLPPHPPLTQLPPGCRVWSCTGPVPSLHRLLALRASIRMNSRALTTLVKGGRIMGGTAWGGCPLPNSSFIEGIDSVFLAIGQEAPRVVRRACSSAASRFMHPTSLKYAQPCQAGLR